MQNQLFIFNSKLNLILVGLISFLCFAITSNALAADGDLDSTFNLTTSFQGGTIKEIALQPDGKILLGGSFQMGGFGNNGSQFDYSRLNTNGSLDPTFFSGLRFSASKYLVLPNGKIMVGGAAQNFNNSDLYHVTRRNPDATYDTSFFGLKLVEGGINVIEDMALQADGKVMVVGNFIGAFSAAYPSILRETTNGIPDNTFINPNFIFSNYPDAHRLRRVIVQPDGKILIGGGIEQINGVNRHLIARLNADGSLDTTFTPNLNGIILTDMVLQPDGKILVSRLPFIVQGNPIPANIVRLNSDGSLDNSFTASADENVGIQTVARQADGKILVGGAFTNIRGAARNGMARLNADGTLDASFITNFPENYQPNKIVVQPDGKILVSAGFGQSNSNAIVRLKGTSVQQIPVQNRISDFDGDGKADASVFRSGTWFINPSNSNPGFAPQGFYGVQFGAATDKLSPADYDGDGKTDIAVYREGAFAYFYILQSSNNTVRTEQFGQTGDVLTVGDWDGDGKADPAVYRSAGSAGAQSYFFYRPSTQPTVNFIPVYWGTAGDVPQRGDFDGDGKTDASVFRPSDGIWHIRQSSNSQSRSERWGLATDKFVPNDYDGDGRTDLAVFRSGTWYIRQSSNNQPLYRMWGADSDLLVPADYDGDGKSDVAVWRGGVYYILQSANSQSITQPFGAASDVPIASAYVN